MFQFLLRRSGSAVLTLLVTSVLVFLATMVLPGDVATAILGQDATPELVATIQAKLGLNRPIVVQYFDWIQNLARGNFGESFANSIATIDLVTPRFWNTLLLAFYAAVVALPTAVLLGLFASAYPGSVLDRIITFAAVFLTAIPDFVIALFLVAVLSVGLGLFPAVIYNPNWSNPFAMLWQLFLPMLTLFLTLMSHAIRMTRAAVMDVLASDYVEVALLKGAPKWRVILRHALPNAAGPILSVLALNLGYLVSGVIIVEVVFSYPGLGRLLVDSIFYRDIPVIQLIAMIFTATYIVLNTLADVAFVALSPAVRLRVTGQNK